MSASKMCIECGHADTSHYAGDGGDGGDGDDGGRARHTFEVRCHECDMAAAVARALELLDSQAIAFGEVIVAVTDALVRFNAHYRGLDDVAFDEAVRASGLGRLDDEVSRLARALDDAVTGVARPAPRRPVTRQER